MSTEATKYPIFIPTKGRADIITTHHCFAGLDWRVVVHNEQEKDAYSERVQPDRIVVSGVPGDAYGLTRQREWITKNLVSPGEWFIFADDNIKQITAVEPKFYNAQSLPVQEKGQDWRSVYGSLCDSGRIAEIAQDCIQAAGRVGAHLVGFATTGNPYFRGRKWSFAGYVIGKMMLWHNVPYKFDHTITMEDFKHTAEHLLRYGAVVINRFVFPEAGHYQHGGMGSYQERISYRRADCKKLMAMYPGLFNFKERDGFEPHTDLSVRLHSPKQIRTWRKGLVRRWQNAQAL